jgi:2-dehydro-3-deoxyphosphooctonate aldolase (KDO 8-P synthase)
MDATHAVALPGGLGDRSGGEREFGPVLARAAAAIGVAAMFIETHQDPDNAPCEGQTMLPLKVLPGLLQTLMELDRVAKARPLPAL